MIPFIAKPFIIPWITEFNVNYIYHKYKYKLPKMLFIHALNDDIVPLYLVQDLAHTINIKLITIIGNHNDYTFSNENIIKIQSFIK